MTTNIPDPIDNGVERVLVRNTVTGFEQGIAATIGLLTAGPLGALASWGTIRGVQGKWTPWFLLGIPAATVINVLNVIVFLGLASETDYTPKPTPPAREQSSEVRPAPAYSTAAFQVPQYNSAPQQSMPPVRSAIAANSGSAPDDNCWFGTRGSEVTGSVCSVTSRVNANGHTVYDVVGQDQETRTVVLWDNGEVEFFLKGERYVGTYDGEYGHVWITGNNGQAFSFTIPQ